MTAYFSARRELRATFFLKLAEMGQSIATISNKQKNIFTVMLKSTKKNPRIFDAGVLLFFLIARAHCARDSAHVVANPIQPDPSNTSSINQTGN